MQTGTKVKIITTGQTGHVVGPSKIGKIYVNIDNKGWFEFNVDDLLVAGVNI